MTQLQDCKILVVDDDPVLRRLAESALAGEGASVQAAGSGEDALRHFYAGRPDLVVLDVMMPGMDGWETLRHIRIVSDVPVLMLTGESRDEDVVRGLELGADDYVTKPCSMKVLLARVRAALRRAPAAQSQPRGPAYDDGYLMVDLEGRRVTVRGQPVKLSAKEFGLLAYLVENAGRILTPRQILTQVWGWEYQDDLDYVRVYMTHLRQKIEINPKEPVYLRNEHGIGYRFERQRASL
jgi:DNA-binding response OmpR family regulator